LAHWIEKNTICKDDKGKVKAHPKGKQPKRRKKKEKEEDNN